VATGKQVCSLAGPSEWCSVRPGPAVAFSPTASDWRWLSSRRGSMCGTLPPGQWCGG
jgi:hypothetical protein